MTAYDSAGPDAKRPDAVRRTVLVTGGAGYIGSHTAKALYAAGYLPVVFDSLRSGHRAAVKWGPLIEGDIRDTQALTDCMGRYAPVAVIHFAALIEVGESMTKPTEYWDVNLNGTASLINAMIRSGVDNIVMSSTAAVYGTPQGQDAISEAAAMAPINTYGDTKLAAERYIANHCRAHGMTGTALRYFNAAGASGDGDIGEAHPHETHLIPLAIEAALGLAPPLSLFGSDFPTPDGTCVRDFVHVEDLARAHVMAIERPVDRGSFDALNLGTGTGTSVLEIIKAVSQQLGRDVPYKASDRRSGDPSVLVADPTRAREMLGWSASQSSINQIVDTAARWRINPQFGFNDTATINEQSLSA